LARELYEKGPQKKKVGARGTSQELTSLRFESPRLRLGPDADEGPLGDPRHCRQTGRFREDETGRRTDRAPRGPSGRRSPKRKEAEHHDQGGRKKKARCKLLGGRDPLGGAAGGKEGTPKAQRQRRRQLSQRRKRAGKEASRSFVTRGRGEESSKKKGGGKDRGKRAPQGGGQSVPACQGYLAGQNKAVCASKGKGLLENLGREGRPAASEFS